MRGKVSSAVVLEFSHDPIASPNPSARKTDVYMNQVLDWIKASEDLRPWRNYEFFGKERDAHRDFRILWW